MVAAVVYTEPSPKTQVKANRSSSDQKYLVMDTEEEVVTLRRVPDGDDSVREIRISCPDATGLGCDVTRLLLDFGLRILTGDLSTDGKWCFLIIKVGLTPGMPAHWKLLKARLEALCPSCAGSLWLRRWRDDTKDLAHPFLLQVSSYDRVGVLHDLMHTLWEADVAVYKAHITTSPAGEVLDMFWLYDNRHQLPDHHRVLEISDQVRTVLGQSAAECAITPAPVDSEAEDSATEKAARCACQDAVPVSPLARLAERRASGGSSLVSSASSLTGAQVQADAPADEFGGLETVSVTLDNATTAAYSLVSIVAADRKGLVYDLMRTLKDIHLRVAYAKVGVRDDGMCEADLFVQEVDGGRVRDTDAQAELVERIKLAVALPVRISIKDIFDETCTELLVTAQLDSGGRGRPRVTYDVTAALNACSLAVFMADIYVEPIEEAAPAGRRPQELHRFLVNCADGTRLATKEQKRAVYKRVKAQLGGRLVGDARRRSLGSPVSQEGQVKAPRFPNDGHELIDSLANWKWSS